MQKAENGRLARWGRTLADEVGSGAILTAIGVLAVWSTATYLVPRLVETGVDKAKRSIADLAGMVKRRG